MAYLLCYDIEELDERRYAIQDRNVIDNLRRLGGSRLQGSVWYFDTNDPQQLVAAVNHLFMREDRVVLVHAKSFEIVHNPIEH